MALLRNFQLFGIARRAVNLMLSPQGDVHLRYLATGYPADPKARFFRCVEKNTGRWRLKRSIHVKHVNRQVGANRSYRCPHMVRHICVHNGALQVSMTISLVNGKDLYAPTQEQGRGATRPSRSTVHPNDALPAQAASDDCRTWRGICIGDPLRDVRQGLVIKPANARKPSRRNGKCSPCKKPSASRER